MNFLTSLRTITLAIILSIGMSYAYAAWSPPSVMPTGGNAEAPVNVGGATQVKSGALAVGQLLSAFGGLSVGSYTGGETPPVDGMIVKGNVGIGVVIPTEKFDVSGNIKASGNLQTPTICLSGDCKSAWPVASGVADWNTMINTPAGFVDNIDNEGPTVTKSPAVYRCPPAPGGCSPISGSTCTGSLSTNPTCTYKDSCSGPGSFTVLGCNFVGYLVQ